jgi:Mor family transcriptional regulator
MSKSTKYPESLIRIREIIVDELKEQGITQELAEHSAHHITEAIRTEFGGTAPYIGKGLLYELSQRDAEIWAKFNGKNHHALVSEYGITMVWLYKIIKHQRQAMIKDKQTDLF